MSDQINIVVAGPADAVRFARMKGWAFRKPAPDSHWVGILADSQCATFLALAGDAAVGMATGTVMPQQDMPSAFYINEIAVAPGYRCRGIATRLMHAMFDVAQRRGCGGVWLGTEAENSAARALYRKLGGRETQGVVIFDWDCPPVEGCAADVEPLDDPARPRDVPVAVAREFRR
jgi:ribosomal protein S18 acetylase RimI-like enzyme